MLPSLLSFLFLSLLFACFPSRTQIVFSPMEFSATSFSRITEADSNTDVQLVVGPPAEDASAEAVGMFILFLVALLLGTCGCLWAILGFCKCVLCLMCDSYLVLCQTRLSDILRIFK